MSLTSAAEIVRASGIGASEIAAILGLSPWADPWIIYARKHGMLEPQPKNDRMKWGTRLQRVIAEAFSEEMGMDAEWCDQRRSHPERVWQFASPDALIPSIASPEAILEVKTAAFDQSGQWDQDISNEDGVPVYYAVQAYWQMSTLELEHCWMAVLIGGSDFRIYHIARDLQVEAKLLEEGEKFWRCHILSDTPPPIGASTAARDYLKRRFPRNTERPREATSKETAWLDEYARVKREQKVLEHRRDELENELKQAVGDSDGLVWPRGRVTWRRCKDSSEINWEGLALSQLAGFTEDQKAAFIRDFTFTKHGSRRFLLTEAQP